MQLEKRVRLLIDRDLDQEVAPELTQAKGLIATAADDCYHTCFRASETLKALVRQVAVSSIL